MEFFSPVSQDVGPSLGLVHDRATIELANPRRLEAFVGPCDIGAVDIAGAIEDVVGFLSRDRRSGSISGANQTVSSSGDSD